jgi:hypothetical protein
LGKRRLGVFVFLVFGRHLGFIGSFLAKAKKITPKIGWNIRVRYNGSICYFSGVNL